MMKLGAFSVSLAVADIHKSKAFYEKLGFTVSHGDIQQNWIIMNNGNTTIGLFQDMFEGHILTFNPGWNQDAIPLDSFDDIRIIQQQLKDKQVSFITEPDPNNEKGPASFIISDPDGNMILVDQHV